MQQGPHAARNILLAIARKPLAPFRYRDKGNLATIGRAAAVADFGRVHAVRIPGLVRVDGGPNLLSGLDSATASSPCSLGRGRISPAIALQC
jgi:hypothetical protein